MGRWLDQQQSSAGSRLTRWQRAKIGQFSTPAVTTPTVTPTPTPTPSGPMRFDVGAGFDQMAQGEAMRQGYGPVRADSPQALAIAEAMRRRAQQVVTTPPNTTQAPGAISDMMNLGKMATDIIRAVPRAVVSPAMSVFKNPLVDKPTQNNPFVPYSPASRFILGEEPIKSIPERIASAGQTVSPFVGQKIESGKPIGFVPLAIGALGVGASEFLDTFFNGPSKAIGKATAERILKQIAESTGKEVEEQLAKQVAKEVAEAAATKGYTARKAALQAVKDNYASRAAEHAVAQPGAAGEAIQRAVRPVNTPIHPSLQPLAEKAKGLSVDEFNAQFESGLKSQNLTTRETAANVQRVMRDNGFNTPTDFYNRVTQDVAPTRALPSFNQTVGQVDNIRGVGLKDEGNFVQIRVDKKTGLPLTDALVPSDQVATLSINKAEWDQARKTRASMESLLKSKLNEAIGTPTPALEPRHAPELTTGGVVPPERPTLPSETPTPAFDPQKYVQEQIKARSAARGGGGGPITFAKKLYHEAKAKLIDSNAPIEDVLRTAQKKGKYEVLPEKNITNAIDRALRAPTLAGQFARDGGMETLIKKVDNLDNLDQYLIAKHAIELDAKGITTGRNIEADKKLVAAFAPKYEAAAKTVQDYSHKLLDYSVESGLISKDLATSLKKEYPHYVPFQRVFSEIEKAGMTMPVGRPKAVAHLGQQSVVQKIFGSDRQIEPPIESLLSKTNDAFLQGERNKAAQLLADYRNLPNNPFNITPIASTSEAVTGMGTFSAMRNGVKEVYQTTPEIAQAAKALNVQQLNILGRIFALPVRIAKLGITGINLPFVGANVARDQMFTMITSKNSLKTSIANPVNFVRSMFSALKHDKLYEEMVRAGAGGTSFDIARNAVPQTVERIRSMRNPAARAVYTVRHPGELLRAVEDIVGRSEEFSRMTQFRGTQKAMIGKGMAPERATVTAAQAARENSANFVRRGEWGSVLNSAFLYLNASIQGSRAFIRAFGRSPVQTSAKVAAVLFFPMATITAWNLSDPKRKAAYEDIARYEKDNNFIIVPPNPVQDERGRWNVIKMPLPPGVGQLTVPVRVALEQAQGLDPLKFADIAYGLVSAVSPINPDKGSILSSLTPQAIKPTIEAITNTNLFTGLPQVPASMEGLSPELQAKPYTSGTARVIGRGFGVAPIKVEEFIKGTMGGVGSQVLHFTDQALAGANIIPPEQVQGQKVMDAILARFQKARGGQIVEKEADELKTILTSQADDRFRLKQEAEALYQAWVKLPQDQANANAKELALKNKPLFDKLKTVAEDEKLGLTYSERLVKDLSVETGARAKFIWGVLQGMKTPEEKNAYLSDLQRKKIVSKDVYKQLLQLARQ